MPIVPTFNGGAPSVGETVSSAPQAQLTIPSTESYERLMNTAMKTMNDGINTIDKAMEVADARYVKAQSDEVETQAINIINSALYDKDRGYFTQQGKNAMESYESVSKGIGKDIDEIIAKQDPRVQEAVRSRIQQRVSAAGVSMQKWYTTQANSYNTSTSVARVNALTKDCGEHYADKNYVETTLLSIADEVEYQGRINGLSAEAISQQKEKIFNIVQTLRYRNWSSDDPEGALVSWEKSKASMPREVRDKIEDNIKKEFASNCFERLIGTKAAETLDVRSKTGWEVFDSLDPKTKLSMLKMAHLKKSETSQTGKRELNARSANALAEIRTTGQATNPPTMDEFVYLYGEEEGNRLYKAYSDAVFVNETVRGSGTMSVQQMNATLEYLKPKQGDANAKEKEEFYLKTQRAFAEVNKARSKDMIGFAMENDRIFHPVNFDTTNGYFDELKGRVSMVSDMAKSWGLEKPSLLSNDELKSFVLKMDSLEAPKQIEILTNMRVAIGEEGIKILAGQLDGKKEGNPSKYAIAMSGLDVDCDGGLTAGEKYLIGMQALKDDRVKVVKSDVDGTKAKINEFLGNLHVDQNALEKERELCFGVWCANAAKRSSGSLSDVKSSVREAMGGDIYNFHGRSVVLPKDVKGNSWFGVDIEGKVLTISNLLRRDKSEKLYVLQNGKDRNKEELANDLKTVAQLETLERTSDGGIKYRVLVNGQYVGVQKDKKSNPTPYIIEIRN